MRESESMYRLYWVIALLVCVTAAPAWGEHPESPRIERLRKSLGAEPRALGQFWSEVSEQGTPLIENIPGDTANVLVTFLLRGDAELPAPVVFANVLPDNDPAAQRLINLPGSDVWYRTFHMRSDLPVLYELSVDGPEKLQRDPLNREYMDGAMGGSIAYLPGVRGLEWSRKRNVPEGRIESERFSSAILRNERNVRVYLPAGFVRGGAYDLLVMMDEDIYSGAVPLTTILDNLIAEGRIQPLIAVLAGNVDRAAELACSAEFEEMLGKELLPWVAARYALKPDRARMTIAGSSLGGLASACAGWRKAEVFGSVVTLSGSFRWRPHGEAEPEWFTRMLAISPVAPVRFYVGVGSHETGTPREAANPSLLTANRHLRDVLRAKGYAVQYREFPGAHEPLSWRAAIVEALLVLQQ